MITSYKKCRLLENHVLIPCMSQRAPVDIVVLAECQSQRTTVTTSRHFGNRIIYRGQVLTIGSLENDLQEEPYHSPGNMYTVM